MKDYIALLTLIVVKINLRSQMQSSTTKKLINQLLESERI